MEEVIGTFILTPIIMFGVGYLLLRLSGKKAVSEMNSFDLVFILVLGNIIAEPLVSHNVGKALYYGAAFVGLYYLFSIVSINNKFRWNLIARPTPLLRDGDILEEGLRKVRMTTDELLSELRIKGYTHPKDIQLVMMENMGKISVVPKSETRPLQPKDIQLQPSPEFIPVPLIMNGQILTKNLDYLGKDIEWMDMHLRAHNHHIDEISDITLAVLNQDGSVGIDTDKRSQAKTASHYTPGNP